MRTCSMPRAASSSQGCGTCTSTRWRTWRLENIRNTQKIRAVVADGRLYRRADLDRLLAEVELLNQKVEKQEKE